MVFEGWQLIVDSKRPEIVIAIAVVTEKSNVRKHRDPLSLPNKGQTSS